MCLRWRKEIFESIMYLFGENLDLHVEFWEKVVDDINSMISTELKKGKFAKQMNA